MTPDEQSPAPDGDGQLAQLTEERDRLAKEKEDLQGRLLYARAKFDNARRRA